MKIDYNNITNFQRNVNELVIFLLWCTVTPGKRSDVITPKFNNIFVKHTPINVLRMEKSSIKKLLEKEGIGQYERITNCWKQIHQKIKPLGNLDNITRNELLEIDGIGNKTASFFIAHSQRWCEVAVLDVHVLKWLQSKYPKYDVPEQTPTNLEEYERLEQMFLGIACKRHLAPSELDNKIWKENSLSS